METVCENGQPKVKLHGLRMLRPAICQYLPVASADSAGVSRSIGTTNWGGCYRQASDPVKARVLIEHYESVQGAARWAGIPSCRLSLQRDRDPVVRELGRPPRRALGDGDMLSGWRAEAFRPRAGRPGAPHPPRPAPLG